MSSIAFNDSDSQRMNTMLRWISNRLIVFLAVIAVIVIASFDLALIAPSLFQLKNLPSGTIYLYLVLFAGSVVSVFAVVPIMIYQFRQNIKLQDAINHYVKNKMQEIMLAVDLVESNLIHSDTSEMTFKEKVQMLEDVRAICRDVSGNLAEKILAEAPRFKHNIANATEFKMPDAPHKPDNTGRLSKVHSVDDSA
jgi:hypothetical protein